MLTRIIPTLAAPGFRISNLALFAIIALLAAGILLDGTLYNKPPPENTIHRIDNPQSIQLHFEDQMILGFDKVNDHWHQTIPVTAPALQQRVQVLLDTNKFNQRRYPVSEVPSSVFTDPIALKINQVEYLFGSIEPVSKLRYVSSEDTVYLQPDAVIPLLGAVNNAFVDLKVTDTVQQLTISNPASGLTQKLTGEQADSWSQLMAVGVTGSDTVLTEESHTSLKVHLTQSTGALQLRINRTAEGYTVASDNGFTYLLDGRVAESLGLVALLGVDK